MPVAGFLCKLLIFYPKGPKNLHKNGVGSGYLSIPVVALRGLVPLGVAHYWQLAFDVSNQTPIFVSTYAIGAARWRFSGLAR
ncbi:hypothetical protein ACQKPE_22705 [Pseudomonas sp. NPDC089554]|uniref:hypothetical protein n=1 Tax=Pseudomonas sp. NPDC089554 TaxID=3390653 RepID=UPI003CFBE042